MENYRHELDGLRAIAMLGVLVFHLGLAPFQSGYLGVDVFFVLSGFLITRQIARLHEEDNFSFIDFYIRRARRLLPMLFLVIISTLLVGVILLSPEHLESAAESGLYATISVANIHYWLSAGYFDLSNVFKPFLHFWSLSVEEQFYLIWPVLITFSGKYLGLRFRVGVIAILSLISLIAYSALSLSSPNAVFFLMPFRIWEFGLGAMIALSGLKIGKGRGISSLVTLLGLVLIGASFLLQDGLQSIPVHYLLAVSGTGLVISAPLNPISKSLLANPPTRYLGRISYSFYLWHWPVIIYLNYYGPDEMSAFTMVAAVLISFVLSCLSYRFVENKFRKPWTKTPSLERAAVPAGLLALMSVILVFASHPWAQEGWPQRLSTDQRDITMGAQERSNPNCKRRTSRDGKVKLCIFGEQEKQVHIAIIGDSHSNGLAAGLALALQKRKLTGAASSKGGMGPFLGADHFRNAGEWKGNRDSDFQAILDEAPEYVILHARYAVYWTTEVTRQDKRDLRIFLVNEGEPYNNSIENSQNIFRQSMTSSVRAIQQAGSIPVIVGPVPNPGVNIVECLSKPLIRDLALVDKHCSGFTQKQSSARTAEVEQFLRDLADKTGAIYVNSNPVFCRRNAPACDRARKNKLLYRDGNHLSLVGARILANNVMKEIEQFEASSAQTQ